MGRMLSPNSLKHHEFYSPLAQPYLSSGARHSNPELFLLRPCSYACWERSVPNYPEHDNHWFAGPCFISTLRGVIVVWLWPGHKDNTLETTTTTTTTTAALVRCKGCYGAIFTALVWLIPRHSVVHLDIYSWLILWLLCQGDLYLEMGVTMATMKRYCISIHDWFNGYQAKVLYNYSWFDQLIQCQCVLFLFMNGSIATRYCISIYGLFYGFRPRLLFIYSWLVLWFHAKVFKFMIGSMATTP